MKKKKSNLPIVDITKYELCLEHNPITRRMSPVKNTYACKKTGDVVKINYIDGHFRLLT